MGGMLAQVMAQQEPRLVRRLVLAGTGPARGRGHRPGHRDHLSRHGPRRNDVQGPEDLRLLHQDGEWPGSGQGLPGLARLKERTNDRDKSISILSIRAQLKAIHQWGKQAPADLSRIDHPVLMINGDHDRMVPTLNTVDMAGRLPNAELKIYPDAGHGGGFQYHEDYVNRALDFLER